jgi:hypothetical protein
MCGGVGRRLPAVARLWRRGPVRIQGRRVCCGVGRRLPRLAQVQAIRRVRLQGRLLRGLVRCRLPEVRRMHEPRLLQGQWRQLRQVAHRRPNRRAPIVESARNLRQCAQDCCALARFEELRRATSRLVGAHPVAPARPKRVRWKDLRRRVFWIAPLVCPWGGRFRLVAVVRGARRDVARSCPSTTTASLPSAPRVQQTRSTPSLRAASRRLAPPIPQVSAVASSEPTGGSSNLNFWPHAGAEWDGYLRTGTEKPTKTSARLVRPETTARCGPGGAEELNRLAPSAAYQPSKTASCGSCPFA